MLGRALFLLFIILAPVRVGLADTKGPLRKIFGAQYEPFDNPRAFNGPGTVFRLDKKKTEIIVANAGECFTVDDIVKEGDMVFGSFSSYVDIDFEAGANVIPKTASADTVSLAEGFKKAGVKTVQVSFGPSKAHLISEVSLRKKIEEVQSRKDKACMEALSDKAGQRHYIIVEAVQTMEMRYRFQDDRNTTLNVTSVLPRLGLKLGNKVHKIDDYTLAVIQPMYVAYKKIATADVGARVRIDTFEGEALQLELAREAARGATAILAEALSRPPRILRIIRGEPKPGGQPGQENAEVSWPKAFAKAKSSVYFLGMSSVSSPGETWFLQGCDSFISLEKTEQSLEWGVMLKAEAGQLRQQGSDLLPRTWGLLGVYREDLSYRASSINMGKARYIFVTTYHVRPGYDEEFAEARRIINVAYEKTNLDQYWATYQVVAGAPSGTYLLFFPMKSLGEIDTALELRGKVYQEALDEDNRKKLRDLVSTSTIGSEVNLFAFSPKMSYVSSQFAAADPDFWTPKAVPAAKKAAGKPASRKQ